MILHLIMVLYLCNYFFLNVLTFANGAALALRDSIYVALLMENMPTLLVEDFLLFLKLFKANTALFLLKWVSVFIERAKFIGRELFLQMRFQGTLMVFTQSFLVMFFVILICVF